MPFSLISIIADKISTITKNNSNNKKSEISSEKQELPKRFIVKDSRVWDNKNKKIVLSWGETVADRFAYSMNHYISWDNKERYHAIYQPDGGRWSKYSSGYTVIDLEENRVTKWFATFEEAEIYAEKLKNNYKFYAKAKEETKRNNSFSVWSDEKRGFIFKASVSLNKAKLIALAFNTIDKYDDNNENNRYCVKSFDSLWDRKENREFRGELLIYDIYVRAHYSNLLEKQN